MSERSVITVGTYDGVHVGHRAILSRARQLGREHGAEVVVLVFEPHPMRVLRPGSRPPRLVTLREKADRLREAGADRIEVMRPTRRMLGQEAESFVAETVRRYRPVAWLEGPDFRFGRKRQGDVTLLERLGPTHGYRMHMVPPVEVTLTDGLAAPASSSLARWLVGHGRMLDAARCLGEPFDLTGRGVAGAGQGRELGVPTVNLDAAAHAEGILPADGVYAGTGELEDGSAYAAALSIGHKPAYGGGHDLAIEAHLLDFEGDLYDRLVTLRFTRWLRDQFSFPDTAALRRRIERDLAGVRAGRYLDQAEARGQESVGERF